MGGHYESRTLPDGFFVIFKVRSVCGADFNEFRAGLAHNVGGDAKTAANFHQLRARDGYLFALGQGAECQQYRAGVVVDHERVFRATQTADKFSAVAFALAPFAG